ncbi:CAP domain-containing protein [Celeribacter baekdonensis]|uniref:CAP domain-containing protein n=1 Tax=Celeribacter baekdonensis TaxID=875171 RepID=UPI0030DA1CC9|tara:strand:+ start:177298 stop:177810 length:513 start_codon:yes stop_codon:yes gene_type:complete
MRKRTTACAITAALMLTACGPETGTGFDQISPVSAPTATSNSLRNSVVTGAQVISLINAERAKQGIAALTPNAKLAVAAQRHADDLVAQNYFSHTGKNGSTVGDRVTAAGYRHCLVAENLSAQYPTIQQAVAGWMNSPGHRKNMLFKGLDSVGVGVSDNMTLVAVFAHPC